MAVRRLRRRTERIPAPRTAQEPLQALPEHPLPCRAVPRPSRVRAHGHRAAQPGLPAAAPGRRLGDVVNSARRAARAPFRRAVPPQGRGQVPIVRAAALVEAAVNVLHLPAEVAQGRGGRGGFGARLTTLTCGPVSSCACSPNTSNGTCDAGRTGPGPRSRPAQGRYLL